MSTEQPDPAGSADAPSPLTRAVVEVEGHVTSGGWDQQPRLYALAPTHELMEREPELATRLGLTRLSVPEESLTPIEQELPDQPIEDLLPTITWPDTVQGCVLAIERIVLPPGAEGETPEDDDEALNWAQNHPLRQDVRVVVGVLRDGTRTSVLRVRGHEGEDELIRNAELSPEIGNALADTFT